MTHDRIEIALANLVLNRLNDRHGELESEHECITWMLENIGDQIIALARDIATHGLSPLDGILVLPDDEVEGDYIVWEGNRRITALKLLDDPKRTIDKSYRKKFADIRKNATVEIPGAVECTVATSVEEAERLIELRHQGPQSGIGTVPWSPGQKSRHQQRLGKKGRYAFSQAVIDAFADKLDPEIVEKVESGDFAISTLDRLLRNAEVRDFLGITSEDGIPRRTLRREETVKGLRRMVSDIAAGLPVGRVYDAERQKAYIDSFENDEKPDHSKSLNDSVQLEPVIRKPGIEEKSKKKRRKPHRHERMRVIPNETKLKISDRRLNSIHWELLQLEIPRFGNAASVLMRVFLELSTDAYLDTQGITYNSTDSLSKRVQAAVKHLRSKNWLTNNEAKGINSVVSAKESPYSINSFNAYVHNKHFNPSKEYLIDGWDNMEPYFIAIFEHL
ncbi:hypothetical protein PC39_03027 [Salinisphaera sp. PC39]